MSLVKPIVNEIVAFDATIGTTVTFSANGGDQVVKNEIKVVYNEYVQGYYNSDDHLFYQDSDFTTLIIGQIGVIYIDQNTSKNYIYQETGEEAQTFIETDLTEIVAYSNYLITFEFKNSIPANKLINGRYYKIAIRTSDILGNTSDWSNYQPFYCYTTPTIRLNVTNGQIINTTNYSISLTYNQIENEKLDYAIIELYNTNQILINSSGNMYSTDYPPIIFKYDILGLDNHAQYYIKAKVVTINSTIIETDMIRVYVEYNISPEQTTFTATLDSCNGYVNLRSGIISNIVGTSNPNPLIYYKNQMADIRNAVADISDTTNAYWAKWGDSTTEMDLFTIPTNFLLRLWFNPARQPFEIIKLINNDESAYIKVSQQRDATQDYLSIRTNNGTKIDVPLGIICNGNTKIFLWIKVIEDTWDVRFDILENPSTALNWNSINNNIAYNVTTDITWGNESYGDFIPSANIYYPLNTELTKIIVGNGMFDQLDITKDINITYSTDLPTWTLDSIISVDFNGNLKGTPRLYNKLVLKRKDETLFNWMNLSEAEVTNNTPTYIDFNDSFIPTGIKQEYALVLYENNSPSEYHTLDVTPIWGKYFLSDRNTRFILNYAVLYNGHVQNIQNGVFVPIGATYPIVVQNGEGNYRSGSLQFKVLGYQYEINQRLDRVSIKKQTDDILAFLTNGKAKCLTDFNGNIFILKVINSPQISYDGNWGNGITTISFDWVEQGKYNDYNTMLELGLFDQITTQ